DQGSCTRLGSTDDGPWKAQRLQSLSSLLSSDTHSQNGRPRQPQVKRTKQLAIASMAAASVGPGARTCTNHFGYTPFAPARVPVSVGGGSTNFSARCQADFSVQFLKIFVAVNTSPAKVVSSISGGAFFGWPAAARFHHAYEVDAARHPASGCLLQAPATRLQGLA